MLPNYRLLCPNALFFRDGHPCEDCRGRFVPWPGVVHACYRSSRVASTTVAAMLTVHRALRTWNREVDLYIAPTEFARRKFVDGGLPAEKIVVKPNFVHPDPGYSTAPKEFTIFVGRLSPKKGLDTVISAWQQLGEGIPLKVIGEGPLAGMVADVAAQLPVIEVLGRQPMQTVNEPLGRAHFLVFPSKWYEGLPRIVIEAFAKGTPVSAPNLGSMSTLVEDGRTGLLFSAGAPDNLAAKVAWAWAHPRAMAEMGWEARHEYQARYTAEQSYERLMTIYEMALGHSPRIARLRAHWPPGGAVCRRRTPARATASVECRSGRCRRVWAGGARRHAPNGRLPGSNLYRYFGSLPSPGRPGPMGS